MSDETPNDTPEQFLTTTAAARYCAVSPNTILKWINQGKLVSRRTPGGHYRIPVSALEPIVSLQREQGESRSRQGGLLYCWEFHSHSGTLDERCLDCVVYRSRAGRCFALAKTPGPAEHCRFQCAVDCKDCEFYAAYLDRRAKLLLVSDREEVKRLYADHDDCDSDWLRFSDDEYHTGALLDIYRPDYIIIDCSHDCDRTKHFAKDLKEDPRIPDARIILVGKDGYVPEKCEGIVYAFVTKSLDGEVLDHLIDSL